MEQIKNLKAGIKFKNTPIGTIPVDWALKPLIETASEEKYSFTGGPFGSDLKEKSYTGNGVRIIQLQNIGDGKFLDDYKIFTSEEKANQLRNCNIYPGDLIIAKMADPVARACKVPNKDKRYLMASDGIRLAVNKKSYDVNFILYAINSQYFRKNAEKHSTGTTRLRIGLTELKNLPLAIPPLSEQKKITEILSSVDEATEKTAQIIEKIKKAKKGLMQKLLTRGIGHEKFKKTEIGDLPENWEVCKIDNLVIEGKNGIKAGPFGSELKKSTYQGIGYKIYGQEQVIANDFSIGNYYISEERFRELKDFEIRPKDVLISLVGTFGRISIVPENIEKGIINPRLIKISPNIKKILPEFLKYLLTSELLQIQMNKHIHGGTMGILNAKIIKSLYFPVPPIFEQEAINSILFEVDDEIEKEENYKRELELLKKGLMQILLTGKIRVTV